MNDVIRPLRAALGLLMAATACGSTHGSLARASIALENGSAAHYVVPSTLTPTGNQKFSLSLMVDGVSATWDYAADLNPDGTSIINGSVTFVNTTAKTVAVHTEFSAPLCPPIAGNTKIGGVASVKLVAGADGGKVGCASDDKELDMAITTGAEALPLFWCPFDLEMSGAGTATTSSAFGTPIPSMNGPEVVADLGHGVALTISPGDKVVMTIIFLAKGDFQKIGESTCVGDANRDRLVDGGDLALVMNEFGSLATCDDASDVNGDGWVDGADLAELLSHWGHCEDPK